ncbi:MAG: DUF4118 domain-containing protein, partial [Candidatus Competibacter denitrificans]
LSTRDALLVCIGPEPGEEALIRAASRIASKLDAEWHALYVETPTWQRLPEARRRLILDTLKLAQDLGAHTATKAAAEVAPALIEYAQDHHLTTVVVSRSPPTVRWRGLRRGLAGQLAQQAPQLDLLVLARDAAPQRPPPAGSAAEREQADDLAAILRPYGMTLLIGLATALAATPLLNRLDLANIVMLFLLAVVVVAVRYGRGPAVLAAIVNVLTFDFFFVPPRFSFAVHDIQYALTFAVMLTVGLVVGQLTARFRYQAYVANAREVRARHLYEMSRELSGALTVAQVVEISERCVEASFRVKAHLLLPDDHDRLQAPLVQPGKPKVDTAIAQWSFDHNDPAGMGTDTLPGSSVLYLPLKAPLRMRGVLAVAPEQRRSLLIPEQRRLLDTFGALIAIALERVHFVEVARDTLVKMEGERQRNSLLAALSHDLRTPLTGLIGLAETLALELAAEDSPHQNALADIREQAVRMALLTDNLLDMARLQTGGIRLRQDWQSLEEILDAALQLLEQPLRAHPVHLALDPKLPLLYCDGALMERVLVNLLENAAKYTPPGTAIGVTATAAAQQVRIEVWDEGPGLPAGREQALFAKFSRGQAESAAPGVGLGLAICQAVVDAHGGQIQAANRPGGGASFLVTLPLAELPPVDSEAEAADIPPTMS